MDSLVLYHAHTVYSIWCTTRSYSTWWYSRPCTITMSTIYDIQWQQLINVYMSHTQLTLDNIIWTDQTIFNYGQSQYVIIYNNIIYDNNLHMIVGLHMMLVAHRYAINKLLGRWSVFSACFIALRILFLAGPNNNTPHECSQTVVLGGIGTTVMLFLSHSSPVMSDLLIDAVSKNKAAGAPSVCLRMTWILESCCHP